MNILKKIKFNLLNHPVPYEIKEFWLAFYYMDKKKYDGKTVRMPYFKYKRYVSYNQGDLVEFFRIDGVRFFYKIIKKYKYESARSPWADLAPWDDGYNYDLEFDHIEK